MPKLNINKDVIQMSHGSGGKATAQLVNELFKPAFNNPYLNGDNDGAIIDMPSTRIVSSCDAHVVSPLFFPGGNIGDLAINGSINDVAMMGAKPLYLTASFILEEGLPLKTLHNVILTMAECAAKAEVKIIAGDTKVVEKGLCDGIYITTTAIGSLITEQRISADNARAGDVIIISGEIGNHGIAVMSQRENLSFTAGIESDTAALHTLVQTTLETDAKVHCLRDPTRGGVATSLNEILMQSKVAMKIYEDAIPINQSVLAATELLGLEPLHIANEGILLAIVDKANAQNVLQAMQAHPLGQKAAIIGEVIADERPLLHYETAFGGTRIVGQLVGDILPRIC